MNYTTCYESFLLITWFSLICPFESCKYLVEHVTLRDLSKIANELLIFVFRCQGDRDDNPQTLASVLTLPPIHERLFQ